MFKVYSHWTNRVLHPGLTLFSVFLAFLMTLSFLHHLVSIHIYLGFLFVSLRFALFSSSHLITKGFKFVSCLYQYVVNASSNYKTWETEWNETHLRKWLRNSKNGDEGNFSQTTVLTLYPARYFFTYFGVFYVTFKHITQLLHLI